MAKGTLGIGTSGWNYEHWKGLFYPEDLPQGKWLDFYSRHFNTVEINYSFYRLPEKNLSRFLENATGLAGKLSAILFQLPPFWNVNSERLSQLAAYLKTQKILPGIRCVLEVRNRTWLSEEVFTILKDHNISLCLADWPELKVDGPITACFIISNAAARGSAKTASSSKPNSSGPLISNFG